MDNLAAGGAMGVPFNVLYEVIKEVVVKTKMFKPLLKDLDLTIDLLKPLIDEMEKCNKVLDDPDNELKGIKVQMQKGAVLIPKCSEVRLWNIYKQYKYTNELLGLKSSLRSFYEILHVQVARDVKKTRVELGHIGTIVQDTHTTILEFAENVQQNLVIHTAVKVQGWGAVPVGAPFTVGVDIPLRELKTKLLKDEKVTMLVLTAPGGCGKTTLAIKFCEDYEVKDKFKENIFFVTVSKKSDDRVVKELYDCRGFEFPTLHNEVDVVKWLQQFRIEVGKNPVLFVLDDVWSGSESLLQKFDDFKLPNSKILVTSRFRFPRFGSQYILEPLNIEDAESLFKHSASLGDQSCNAREDIMRKIIEHFKGSPLAITVVGRSLCGKPVESWLKRASTLKGASILNYEARLLDGLQSCLDAFNEEEHILKECFLDLGSFPEDQRISAAALIDMWAELYKLEDFKSIANLHELAARSLANLLITRKEKKEADGYYSEHFITQHDLLRQLAIYQPKLDANNKRRIIDKWGDNLPECLTGQKHQPIKARLLSISSDGVFSTNLDNIELAEVEVLVLNFDTQNYALPEFVVKMDKLKVLIVTNHGFLPAELCNIQLLGSLSNLRRIRLERISISSITKNLIQLKSVKKISLFMCNIGQAFSNCSLQISDALPYLEEMNIDYCNDLVELPAALCALVNLKKLSIANSHKLSALPEEIGKLVNLEVLRLRSCTDLAKLPDSTRNLKKLKFLDIADCFSIRELPEDFGGMTSLKEINMRKCSRLQELPSSVLDLEQLQEVVCDEDTGDLWELFSPHLRNLHITLVEENVNLNWLHKLQ
ncbi:putative powdery mildew resistance protein, RPW8 [Rosa chinensis]|uniref:Putative powdery mildew resistance protein, RPW8 n=1 Tax=Rosa chinensis TaxID=74649 RepID=A0A2P6RN39_ROSCH|nr:probable disease resistance protein At5g66900 isoform X1 [Rosa chinensis]PRQ47842.1 putative powdery mildew resistance protein, RPW8 [Rosa chinensis]